MPSASRHTRTVPSPLPLTMTGVPSGSAPTATTRVLQRRMGPVTDGTVAGSAVAWPGQSQLRDATGAGPSPDLQISP